MFDLKKCDVCPRRCGADRYKKAGLCGQTSDVRIARAALHFWEEPPISGTRGSGTVFFSGCSLGCVYCQNTAISRGGLGRTVSVSELAVRFADLEKQGAHNLNLVTPTHFAPQVIEAVELWRKDGGSLPVVYNTGGYERPEVIQALAGTVDIYLTDLKYALPESAGRYSGAPDYPEVARAALETMVAQTGAPVFDSEELLRRGVIVRLLVLPSMEYEAMMNLKYLREAYGDHIVLSLMNQYTPVGDNLPPELREKLGSAEYQTVVDYALSLGFQNAYIQERDTADPGYIPPFGEGEEV